MKDNYKKLRFFYFVYLQSFSWLDDRSGTQAFDCFYQGANATIWAPTCGAGAPNVPSPFWGEAKQKKEKDKKLKLPKNEAPTS